MAYKINGTQVIDDDGNLVNFSAYNLNNDDGQIEIQSNSPMVGTVSGYTSGGNLGPPGISNVIDKFPFATDTNATDVGDLVLARHAVASQSSTIHGYTSGGYSPSQVNTIDKFAFSADFNATDVGNLSQIRVSSSGQSSFTHGYTSGGILTPPFINPFNTIDKFTFYSDSNATDVGDLTQSRYHGAGQSSTLSGYTSGGYSPPQVNTIDKFSFAVNNNASDVGDLTQARRHGSGQSSTTHGYLSGGTTTSPAEPGIVNTIDKFPFSTDTNASDVGDLTQARNGVAGQSSISSGYSSGGSTGAPSIVNTIDKFPFATDTNATDVGDLTQGRQQTAGQQD
jgi:hypothetical protein